MATCSTVATLEAHRIAGLLMAVPISIVAMMNPVFGKTNDHQVCKTPFQHIHRCENTLVPFTYEMETHFFHPVERREQGYAEKEERKRPEDNSQEDSHDLQHLRRRHGSRAQHKGVRKHLVTGVRHAYKGKARERRRADGDEHSRPGFWQGQPIRHEPADVVAVHEYGDEYPESLEGDARYEDRGRVVGGLGSCDHGGDGSG